LEKQTDDPGDRTADGEELEPRDDDGEKQAHICFLDGSMRQV
jgi:hypothetical protein